MVPNADDPLERFTFEAARLMAEHPPVWRDRNKRIVYEIACPAGCTHAGTIAYSRWRAMAPPEAIHPAEAFRRVERRQDVYDYVPAVAGAMEWHVNFADPHLFVAYGSGLFAQDEMQVAEHPVLGALREALDARGASALTEQRGQPTPVLVKGVERRCRIATDRNAEAGRPAGLYGNAFQAAAEEAIRRATTRIEPPTITNLIAMAAPAGGDGRYDEEEIERILTTAHTGFRAAVLESGGAPAVVHTGFWGCGAFGGNRQLMALLQVLAAGMAGVARLVFHTFDAAGNAAFDAAAGRAREALGAGEIPTRDLIRRIAEMGFEWGVSDGN
ncbi:MAG TPA: hypothetical protein PLS90_09185 [Candidatus Sumerlaeota bacterium]|nr:hypothetical protein [Candidatus Sumerlaeota bacterium]HPK02617.1 hypothetical protein [Candidatus Sumerlaeota bacterium]